ncbi:HAD superfamily hydrolase (plasmid) [Haloferax gibbonsii]|uniref:HAD superfamily hydrolase n=1 Tax=Haloferax gibbonsii TaxID=35746 RepID=A0A871BLH1_HALGI|nr:HAD family hydrolase [Haloferax gibbonsii]QOS13533.1 HAD superfamily hydrolase [Haloferax gibbonsii]
MNPSFAMDGICFDMDGVLVQSEEFWVEKQRTHILPTTAPNDDIPVSAITGRNYREVYDDLVGEYDVALSRREFEALFESAGECIYGEQARLLEGAHDLLSALSQRGVPLALTTSSPHHWIALVDERFRLTEHFDAVISTDDLDGPGKPAPGIYERGVAELDVQPEACVAVEDSRAGVEAATTAGLYTIGFRGDGDDADLTAADEIITGIDELRATLLY